MKGSRRLLRVKIDLDAKSANLLTTGKPVDIIRLPALGERVVEVTWSKDLETVFGGDNILEPKYADGSTVRLHGDEMEVQSSTPTNVNGDWTFEYELKSRTGGVRTCLEKQIGK